jgi:hypothetical protein
MQPYYGNMSIKIPYLRKDTLSTLITFSAAILLLLLASPLILLNLLQPVQAQTSMTFQTPTPAIGTLCTGPRAGADLTFAGQGTFSDLQHAKITSGTFQVTNSSGGQILYSGSIKAGTFTNDTGGGVLIILGDPNRFPDAPHNCAAIGDTLTIDASCSTSHGNVIDVTGRTVDNFGSFNGAVECSSSSSSSSSQGGGSTASSSMTGSSQDRDSDGDGIPDSSDRCPNNSHHRCFKEGDTGTTTTSTDQQPSSSSSSSSGN